MTEAVALEAPETGGKREKILAAGARVFFESGYEGACIDEIIRRVGGSKRTIYNEFGSKEGLFAAIVADVVSRQSREIVARFDWNEESGVSLRQALLDYGNALMELIYSPNVLALYRTIFGEAKRFPALARAFYESGPRRTVGRLAEVLTHFRDRGEILVEDCQRAADQFAGMVRDNLHLAVVLGIEPAPTHDEIHRRIEAAADLFLNGVCAKRKK